MISSQNVKSDRRTMFVVLTMLMTMTAIVLVSVHYAYNICSLFVMAVRIIMIFVHGRLNVGNELTSVHTKGIRERLLQ